MSWSSRKKKKGIVWTAKFFPKGRGGFRDSQVTRDD